MNVKPWMLLQPGFHFRRLVGRVVIHDQVQRLVFGGSPVNQFQESNPVLVGMGGHTHVNHRSILRIHGGK